MVGFGPFLGQKSCLVGELVARQEGDGHPICSGLAGKLALHRRHAYGVQIGGDELGWAGRH